MTKVINIWGGPGAGKSTLASALFACMKSERYKVEIVHEYAKDLTYDANWALLEDQWYVVGKQARRMRRLVGQVDWIITDSPLLLGLAYSKPPYDAPWFRRAVLELAETFENVHVKVHRGQHYSDYGRTQTLEEAVILDERLDDIHERYIRAGWDAEVQGVPNLMATYIMSKLPTWVT